ncbi:hypothetical protein VTN00DRAFT_9348 [Thermoascus crustaceus]|uniref:uncharacterized protein n=1 Tax=Thermoascus crustaceus TaxID=5088 RepID=UPI00374247D9
MKVVRETRERERWQKRMERAPGIDTRLRGRPALTTGSPAQLQHEHLPGLVHGGLAQAIVRHVVWYMYVSRANPHPQTRAPRGSPPKAARRQEPHPWSVLAVKHRALGPLAVLLRTTPQKQPVGLVNETVHPGPAGIRARGIAVGLVVAGCFVPVAARVHGVQQS